jgi:hypothetical protein
MAANVVHAAWQIAGFVIPTRDRRPLHLRDAIEARRSDTLKFTDRLAGEI